MSKPTLVMIARDAQASIAGALESARPFVGPMIVVDTGSSDDTMAIAAGLGAQVHRFAFGDDCSAARNAALDLANADWALLLEADEALGADADPAVLAQLLGDQPPFIGVLPVLTRFSVDGQAAASTSWAARLLPRGVRFAGRVFEQVVSDLPRQRIAALPIVHEDVPSEGKLRLRERQGELLRRALGESPDDPWLHYQQGKQHESAGAYAEAADHYRQALALAPAEAGFRHDLVVRAMFSLRKADAHEEAIGLADREMDHWQDSPDYYFALGDLLLEWAALNPAAAGELVPMVEAAWQKCLEIGERPDLEGAVSGRGSHLAAHNLAALYDGLGEAGKAAG